MLEALVLISSIALLIFAITFVRPIFSGAPFAASSKYNVRKMQELLAPLLAKRRATATDLGSGDGRIVIALAELGLETTGLELNPVLVWWSRRSLKRRGFAGHARIKRASFWKEDLSRYNVVALFGISYIMPALETKLRNELLPGTIVLCNHFFFQKWQPVARDGDIAVYRVDK